MKASLSVPGSSLKLSAYTLEMVAGSQVVAVWDCTHNTAESGCKEHSGMHCNCGIEQPKGTVDNYSRIS